MASVCDIRYYIISPRSAPGSYWYWDKLTKGLFIGTYSSVPDFYELSNGSIIDIVEQSGIVYVVTKGSGGTPIFYNQLFSTSGDGYNKLLSATYNSSPGTLTVKIWSINAKELTTLDFPMQLFTTDSPAIAITPCFNNFTIADNVILNSWCDQFTLNEYVTLSGNAVLAQTFNSAMCGYVAPIAPFRFSEEKEIEYRNCVLRNPMYLTWKNLLGGWDYWMFEKTQIESFDSETLGSFQVDYTKISDLTNPKTERGKTGRSRLLLGANGLNDDQKNALKGLLISNKVYILNQDATVNRQIIVTPGTFLIKISDTIEFEIQEPDINTIRN